MGGYNKTFNDYFNQLESQSNSIKMIKLLLVIFLGLALIAITACEEGKNKSSLQGVDSEPNNSRETREASRRRIRKAKKHKYRHPVRKSKKLFSRKNRARNAKKDRFGSRKNRGRKAMKDRYGHRRPTKKEKSRRRIKKRHHNIRKRRRGNKKSHRHAHIRRKNGG